MRGILTFSLPDEREEFEIAQKGGAFSAAAWEFANFLRSKIKYEQMPEKHREIWEEIRTKFYEEFGDLLD